LPHPIIDIEDRRQFIVPDADPNISGFEFPSRPFEFLIELDNAELVSEMPTSVDGDSAFWEITFTGLSAHVVITEVPQDGFELIRANCFDMDGRERALDALGKQRFV
jgi:hypothetical protein